MSKQNAELGMVVYPAFPNSCLANYTEEQGVSKHSTPTIVPVKTHAMTTSSSLDGTFCIHEVRFYDVCVDKLDRTELVFLPPFLSG